jgi:hypothetical protein
VTIRTQQTMARAKPVSTVLEKIKIVAYMLKLFSELKQVYIEFKVSFRIQEFHSQFNFREKNRIQEKPFLHCCCGPGRDRLVNVGRLVVATCYAIV